MLIPLVAVPGLALAGITLSLQATAPMPAPTPAGRGCAPVAVHLYTRLMGSPVDYEHCVQRFAVTETGASLTEMEAASAELGVPLEARAVRWADLRGWADPLIFLAAPRYAARMPDGSVAQVGHYLAARPLVDGRWQVFDFPGERPAVLAPTDLADYLGVPAMDEVIILAGFTPPAPTSNPTPTPTPTPASYRPPNRLSTGPTGQAPIDLGPVLAPDPGQVVTFTADISGRAIGETVELQVDLLNPSDHPAELSPGRTSCGCAVLTLGDRHLPPAGALTLRGRIMVAASMAATPEYTEVILAREGAPPATLRILAAGVPTVRAIVDPTVVAFGVLPLGGSPAHARIRITAPGSARYDLSPAPSGPITAALSSRPEPGTAILDVTLDPSRAGPGRLRGLVRLTDPTGTAPDLAIPVEAILRPSIHADPPALVLTGRTPAPLRLTDDQGAPLHPTAVEGLADLTTTIAPDGVCSFQSLTPHAPRVQSATLRFGDGRTLSVPVLVRP